MSAISESATHRLAIAAAATLVGALAITAVLQLQNAGYKAWVALLAAVVLTAVTAAARRPREILLFGWVVSLTYNRQYYLFEGLVGYQGTEGPYVMVSDLCVAGLFAIWLWERIMRRPAEPVRSAPLWPWYLPFAAACFLSLFDAARPDWAAFEMLRIARIGLILFYVRRNFGRREWYLTLAALAAAACFQSAVGIKEIATGKQGVVGTSLSADSPDFIEHFEDGAFTAGVRGQGTLAHPPYLSCYLLLVLPVLLALSLTAPRRRAAAAALAFVLAAGGLLSTLSRWPAVLALLEVALVIAALVLLRQVAVQRALGIAILGSLLLALCLLPFRSKLIHRATGDFSESVQLREDGFHASLAAIADHPLTGFGLNNTAFYLPKYFPDLAWGLVTEEFATHTLHLRAPVTFGNGLLHVVEETGILGLAGFLILVIGGLVCGLRSMVRTGGEHRAVCLGLLVGILGVLGEQLVDAPLWVDPVLYTFVLYIGILNVSGGLFRKGALA